MNYFVGGGVALDKLLDGEKIYLPIGAGLHSSFPHGSFIGSFVKSLGCALDGQGGISSIRFNRFILCPSRL